ncbi:hypothetical protein TrVE_jg7104 [Triparma verrucosa]|uniref:Uncharacterized protein n=1 Tax=Triparma verrucosa TaxID=1606542 RepID=A0A9W7FDM6_9STRA|nr:hypothetical protein TrVE_jg7104 [Triparma verrucosa]
MLVMAANDLKRRRWRSATPSSRGSSRISAKSATDVLDEYESIIARISEKPTDEVEPPGPQERSSRSPKRRLTNLCARVDNVHAKIEATSQFCYDISEEDVELMWKIKGYLRKVEESTSEAMERLQTMNCHELP